MGFVVLMPAFLSLWYCVRRSLPEAFISVYMITVFLLPGWGRWVLPGLPDPTFDQATILPIIAIFLFKRGWNFRISFLDTLIILLAGVMNISEYVNAGYLDAQNLFADTLLSIVFPYFLAKFLINTTALRVQFARRIVWSVAIVFVISLYELRFGLNPYRMVFDHFFPGQGDGWVTTFRYGLPRVAGPYGHAISNGVATMIGVQFAFWLSASKLWEPRFRWPVWPIGKATTLLGAAIMELVITFTRAPQIGAVIAWCVAWIGKGTNPKGRARTAFVIIIFAGIPIASWFNSYVSVGRAGALTQAQETAAYRKELLDKYMNTAIEHSWLGWGTSGYPKVPGMPSIDNYYLLLSLMHGFIATGILLLILISTTVRLFRNGMQIAPLSGSITSLSFVLTGTYVGLIFALATVYLGLNVVPIFFMLTGFTEGYLQAGGDRTLLSRQPRPQAAKQQFQFQRVVV
jgi:hypothetical protein